MRNCWVSLARVWLCCDSSSNCFFTSPSVADWAAGVLLEIFLVSFELLLQRFDQRFDRFLPLGEVALGGFLKLAKGLFRQPQKFRRGLFQRIRAQSLEGVPQIIERFFLRGFGLAQALLVELFLFGEDAFGGSLIGLRGGQCGFCLG